MRRYFLPQEEGHRCLDIYDFPFIPIPQPKWHGENEIIITNHKMQVFLESGNETKFMKDVFEGIVEGIKDAEKDKVSFKTVRVVSLEWARLVIATEHRFDEELNRALKSDGAIKTRLHSVCGETWGPLVRGDFGYVLYEVV